MRSDRIAVIALTATAFLIGIIGIAMARGTAQQPHHPMPRICFPKDRWAPAPDHNRPCVYIRLYEDGTFRSQVEQADGGAIRP